MSTRLQDFRTLDAAAVAGSSYGSRHFAGLPNKDIAVELLSRLNDAPCPVSPQRPMRPLALYGAGDLGRLARDYFQAIGMQIDLVIDRNADVLRRDPFWQGISLFHPVELSGDTKSGTQLVVCIATAPYKSLEQELLAEGWAGVAPFYDVAESQRHYHPLSNGWFSALLDAEGFSRTVKVLKRWDDDISRAHHLQFMAWRLQREEWTFDDAPVTREDRFFIPEVLQYKEGLRVFVDAGAHHGKVTERFATLSGGRLDSIVAIEPDEGNAVVFGQMTARLDPILKAKVRFLPIALDACERQRSFHAGLGYASQLSETGKQQVSTRTLDGLALAPDFIKLHLEGGELDALQGAIGTIRQHRPILAITTYHNADGIWQTPAYLMDRLDDYRFLMRLHSWCGTGAVVYAIPMEFSR